MNEKSTPDRRPDPARLEAMKNLPREVMITLTREEVDAFLFNEVWPDTLKEKLKDYVMLEH
ncbi:MAG: hypothetical protein JXL84_05860 [Deltaproteobacteria bacterium]|nr:hypothetical protein [Deltaproteobacteria bacterium]